MTAAIRKGAVTLVLVLSQLAHAQTAPLPQATADADALLLQVVVNQQTISDVINAYQADGDILLPLGELARLLTLAITAQPEERTASGYVLQEERAFSLDLARAMVIVDGKPVTADLRQVDVRANDIYVPSRLLARWLPVDLDVDLSGLTLIVRARERLPLQFRLEREAQAARLGTRAAPTDSGFPRYDIPYRMVDWPFIDQTLSLDYLGSKGSRSLASRYSAYATADLLALQSALYVNTDSVSGTTDVRLTLGRNDPDAGLLGPLHARTALFGSVSAPAEANISRTSVQGEGLLLSNRPLSQPSSFGQHSLIGPLPQDWDVELYLNEALIGYQTSGPDGQYHFDDQPLMFGPNEFRLVFHGPLGQVRVEKETFLLDQSSTSPGMFYYSVALQRDKQGQDRMISRFDWGLSDRLTATGGLVRAPTGSGTEDFAHVGLQSYWNALLLSGDLIRSRTGSLEQLELRTRLGKWAINLSHAELQDFSSEVFASSSDPVTSSTRFRINGSFALPHSSLRLPVTLDASRESRQSGAGVSDVAARISASYRGTLASGQLHWSSTAGSESSDATVQLSRQVAGISFRSQLSYTLSPESRLSTVALSADKRLGKGYLASLSITRLFGSSDSLYTAGLTKSIGHFGLGIHAGHSATSGLTGGLQFFLAMGSDRRGSGWLFDAQPMANTGGVSALVFLDDNQNGRMDPGEQPIQGAGFTVNGGRSTVQTDDRGIAYLSRLPPLQHTDVAVVTETLEDPHWLPRLQGMQLVPRPGAVARIDIPVLQTSEVEGTVHLLQGNRRREIGGVLVEIMDQAGHIVGTSSCGADGYYVVAGVPAGEYLVRASPDQLQRLGLQESTVRHVTVARDSWLVSGIDIELGERVDVPNTKPDP